MDDILQKIVEGDYVIQPNISVALDGGTISFVVKNDNDEAKEFYLDRRMRTETRDVFYGYAYPEREGSVRLGSNDALVAKVEATLKSEGDNL